MSGKHAGSASAQRRRRSGVPVVALIAAVAIGTLAGLTGTGGTYAMWSSSVTVPGDTVTTASMDIEVSSDGHPTLTHALNIGSIASNLAPGDVVATAFTIQSVGSTPQTVSLAAISASDNGTGAAAGALSGALKAALVTVPSTSACTTASATPTAALNGYATSSMFTLAAQDDANHNDSRVLCLVLALSSTAPPAAQGLAVSFTMTLDSVQATA
jgi:hypothetical protein